MDRRLASSNAPVRFRIDATRCDGQGVCVMIAPELLALDRYGLAYVVPGADEVAAADPDIRARGLEADALCPRNAIFEIPAPAPRPAVAPAPPSTAVAPARLAVDEPESVTRWRERGGWPAPGATELLEIVEQAGVRGHGGAAFPTAAKWRRVADGTDPIVVANGAEREPGTLKDRYLLGRRPGLVLDGLRHAMRAVGARTAFVAVDEEAVNEHDALVAAIAEAGGLGLLDGLEVRTHKVPTRYVAGEETALISLLGGGPAVPRLRPPFPADSGLFGRATLVQNVETLAQVALAVAAGPEEYRAVGTEDAPGTGLFSVGPFGGPYQVVERPHGYPLRDLLAEQGLLDGARAVLVGGYAGGLLAPDALDVGLSPAALSAAGVALGTKSVQVVGADRCPVGVAAEIVGYFGAETADQCPPCSRGLPDMAALLRGLETGEGGTAAVEELDHFMQTLFDRGVCRLPDGAARLTVSLLTHFADEVESHTRTGCPRR
jgi:NADH:ubiquinone oxidoreductase subunit F (NADH-binding)/ferredoxin